MTRTEKLLALADVSQQLQCLSVNNISPSTIKQLVELVRMQQLVELVRLQHEALYGLEHYLDPDMEEGYTSAFNEIVNARAEFNKFEGGE